MIMKKSYVITFAFLLAVGSLFVSAYQVSKHKEMEFESIKYISRNGQMWQKYGRVLGELKNPPPELTVEFYSVAQGKLVYTYKAPGQLYVYISRFLPPGKYNLTFKAPEYQDEVQRAIKIEKGKDCLLNVRFGSRVFTNR